MLEHHAKSAYVLDLMIHRSVYIQREAAGARLQNKYLHIYLLPPHCRLGICRYHLAIFLCHGFVLVECPKPHVCNPQAPSFTIPVWTMLI